MLGFWAKYKRRENECEKGEPEGESQRQESRSREMTLDVHLLLCSCNTLDSKETCSVRLKKIYQDLQHRAHKIL